MHWNFFFTLAGIFFLASLLPLHGNLLIIGAIGSLIFHEATLTLGKKLAGVIPLLSGCHFLDYLNCIQGG